MYRIQLDDKAKLLQKLFENVSKDFYVARCEASRQITFHLILLFILFFSQLFLKLHLPANNLLRGLNLRSCCIC